MRILIVSSYYHPETAGNAPYVTGVAEHLAGLGHEVTVLTGFAHYPGWRSSARGRLGAHERRNGVEIRRRWHYVPRRQSAATRAAYEATLGAFGATGLPFRVPDVVLGINPTLAAITLARTASVAYRRPYGLIYQDLQGLAAAQSGISGGARIARVVEYAEVSLARTAAAVGVVAEGFRPYLIENGVDPERIHRLRNWSQSPIPSQTWEEARARLGWGADEFVCLHAGNMGHKQGLENVLRAAAEIHDPGVRIVLAGEGNERAKLQEIARSLELANVSFVPPQPSGLYEAMLAAADVLIVNQRASVGDMSLASKLTSYFMVSRPIVAAVAADSETGRELVIAGAGVLASPEDPPALAERLLWVRDHPEDAAALGASGRQYAEKHLAASSVLSEYEVFLEEVRRAPARRSGKPPVAARAPVPRVHVGTTPADAVVSCLIVSFDASDVLDRCLASLEAQRSTLPIEVVVVDNASTDDSVARIEERHPWVTVVAHDQNPGFAHAANEAMRLARGRYLLHLNPDTVVPPGGLAAAVVELERHPDVGMLGCKLVRLDGTYDHACKRGAPTVTSALYYFFGLGRVFPHSRRFAQYTAGHLGRDEAGYVDAVTGAFMLVRREAVEDVGDLDERFWLYGEDLDWCARFWEHGWKILYWPGVVVTHVKGGSAGGYRRWTPNVAFHRSMWLYYDKHLARRHSRSLSALVRVGIWTNFSGSVARTSLHRTATSVRRRLHGSAADRRGA